MNLTKFKRNPDGQTFLVAFDDGFECSLDAKVLRINCPCAECQGEEVLLHKYTPTNTKPLIEGSFILEKAEMKGNYGIQLYWKDGHFTGIYNWSYLRELAESKGITPANSNSG